jgi:acid stress-induced BolA-like protein IbaG/YrbA
MAEMVKITKMHVVTIVAVTCEHWQRTQVLSS